MMWTSMAAPRLRASHGGRGTPGVGAGARRRDPVDYNRTGRRPPEGVSSAVASSLATPASSGDDLKRRVTDRGGPGDRLEWHERRAGSWARPARSELAHPHSLEPPRMLSTTTLSLALAWAAVGQ